MITKRIFNLFLLLICIAACSPQQEKYPSIIEIVCEEHIDSTQLKSLTEAIVKQNISQSIYQWKNHIVVYGTLNDITQAISKIDSSKRANLTIHTYDKPFYAFNRTMCNNTATAKEWDNIIMTAGLVSDTILQKEYMDRHATQFEEWPEVSEGFCTASFQQLLVFRNGQQLMLVISIPKGASLDELNPKTMENNPRVSEWNTIMSKYQEGIKGTVPGETWVVLKEIL